MPAIASLAGATTVPLVFVYVAEAHAMDDWPLQSRLAMPKGEEAIVAKQHQTNQDRLAAARLFADAFAPFVGDVTLAVDDLESGEVFSKTLHPWPARFFIVEDSVLVWGSQFEPDGTIDFDKFSEQLTR